MSPEVNVTPVAGAKWNKPLTMSRVEEKPTTVTVMPPGVCWKATLLMKGTPGLLTILVGAGAVRATPPAVMLVVRVMVPAVVPVNTVKLLGVMVVLLAGMVKLSVQVWGTAVVHVPPEANWII